MHCNAARPPIAISVPKRACGLVQGSWDIIVALPELLCLAGRQAPTLPPTHRAVSQAVANKDIQPGALQRFWGRAG